MNERAASGVPADGDGAERGRRVVVIEFVTLDGVIQSPGSAQEDPSGGFAHGGWIWPYSDPELGAAIREEMALPFDLLLGRVTFDIWADYWPQRGDAWPGANAATKYVVSTRPPSRAWEPSEFIGRDVAERVAALKRERGPDLHVYGSSVLVQTLLAHGLVDALWLKIHPITLGGGKRLFGDGTMPAAFEVARSSVTSKGVVVARFERAEAPATGGALPQ